MDSGRLLAYGMGAESEHNYHDNKTSREGNGTALSIALKHAI